MAVKSSIRYLLEDTLSEHLPDKSISEVMVIADEILDRLNEEIEIYDDESEETPNEEE